ncbi:MAG: PepSY-like domain-containing protein [Muribaculaceae bacterium]|nr:PepSY-like domain-containing protein [Muribaculaceae bacterium]
MKKAILFLLAACITMGAVAAGPEVIEPQKLPHMAHKILAAYFAGDEVVEAHKEKSKMDIAFDARLASGAYLTFDKQGNWTSVTTTPAPLPKRLIPGKIIMFLNANNAKQCEDVVAIYHDRDTGNYTLLFADASTLTFDEHYNLIEP